MNTDLWYSWNDVSMSQNLKLESLEHENNSSSISYSSHSSSPASSTCSHYTFYNKNNYVCQNFVPSSNTSSKYIQPGDISPGEDLNLYFQSSPEEFLVSDVTEINPSISYLHLAHSKAGKKSKSWSLSA